MRAFRPVRLNHVTILQPTPSRIACWSFPLSHRSCGITTSAWFLRKPAKMAPYEEVLKGKYPGKLHAKKVVEHIRSTIPDATGVIYVEAKKAKLHEDCDQVEHFR